MNQGQIIDSFIAGETSGGSNGSQNLRIVQNKLLHYQTPVAERIDDVFYINMTKYSIVTARIQKMLKEKIPQEQQIIVKSVEERTKKSLSEYVTD